ncbi:phospholipid-binding protein [Capsulimonas corticalis]|uniref:Phospholipid-binding protein n=1 Tax=Capsulimonas corticalis TaxID=2219043 RepID=A0A402CQE9_9BACT|nr:BON domain-containing protein [Capsulimonas corticalis]BDI32734.1 phospholipid-binding protein [Capsulimonas corticalis]
MREMILRRRSLPALGLAVLLTASALTGCGSKGGQDTAASNPSAGQAGDDALIGTQVQSAVTTDPKLDGAEITADAKAGVVTLTGTVPAAAGKAAAEEDAKKVAGVKSVVNSLTVKK